MAKERLKAIMKGARPEIGQEDLAKVIDQHNQNFMLADVLGLRNRSDSELNFNELQTSGIKLREIIDELQKILQ